MEARLHVGFFSFIDNDWFWPKVLIRHCLGWRAGTGNKAVIQRT